MIFLKFFELKLLCIPPYMRIMLLFLLHAPPSLHSLLSLACTENLLYLPLNLDYENDNLISSVSSESYTPLLRLSFSSYYENYPYIRPELLMMAWYLPATGLSSRNAKAYEKDFHIPNLFHTPIYNHIFIFAYRDSSP